jgi:predicted amidophosphoribosyltransferase
MAQQMGQQHQQQGSVGMGQPAPQQTSAMGNVTCAKCGQSVKPGKFCAECGAALAEKKQFCAECGKPMTPGSKFCAECGAKTG